MRNRAIFKKVKKFVDKQGYSIAQIENATNKQIKKVLKLDEEEWAEFSRFVSGIKKLLIQDLQTDIDNQWLIDKKALVKQHFTDRFPDCKFSKDFNDPDNRTLLIELDG